MILPSPRSELAIIPVRRGWEHLPSEISAIDHATIWYFGVDYGNVLLIARQHPGRVEIGPTGQRLAPLAETLLPQLIDLDRILDINDHDAWDASELAERGPYATTLLLNCARMALLAQLADTPGRHAVLVEDGLLAHYLYLGLRQQAVIVGWRGFGRPYRLSDTAARLTMAAAMLGTAVRRRLSIVKYMSLQALRLRRARRKRPLDLAALRRAEALLLVWGSDHTFRANEVLQTDAFLGRIPALTRAAGYVPGIVVNQVIGIATPRAILANAMSAADPVIMVEDCYHPVDVVRAALASLCYSLRLPTQARVGDLDIGPVLRRERWNDLISVRPTQMRVFARLPAWLVRHGARPRLVLHQYENQPWEKMLRSRLREHLPDSRIFAIQHVPLPELFVNNYPSAAEIARGSLPDRLLATSPFFAERFARHGFPAGRIAVIGSLRFEALCQRAKEIPPAPENVRSVLCCTTIDADESFELAFRSARALAPCGDVKLYVNFHPSTSAAFRDGIQRKLGHLADFATDHVEFSDRPARELLVSASAVIYNSSSSAFEALALGRPAIFLRRETDLDYNRLPSELIAEVCQDEDLRIAVRQALEAAPSHSVALRQALLATLGEVDENAILSFLCSASD